MNEIIEDTALQFTSALEHRGIPYLVHPFYDGYQWVFPDTELACGDVAVHHDTYGVWDGCVESYCMPWDAGDVSVLKPIEMAQRIADAIEGTN